MNYLKLHDPFGHLLAFCPKTNSNIMITRVYGPTQNINKDHLWEYLTSFHSHLSLHWMIIGDFNELLQPSDKWGGRLPNLCRFECFF